MWADFVDYGRPTARGKRMHYEKMLMNKESEKHVDNSEKCY